MYVCVCVCVCVCVYSVFHKILAGEDIVKFQLDSIIYLFSGILIAFAWFCIANK